MFKKISFLILVTILTSCNLETPTKFTKAALSEKVYNLNDEVTTFKEVREIHKGNKILIDVWASWCRDCIEGMPKVKELQKEFPEVVFLFLSVDEKKGSWKRGVKHYNVIGEHYNLPKGMKKGALVDFLNVSWIPRYVVIDENGKITVFNATDASGEEVISALKKTI